MTERTEQQKKVVTRFAPSPTGFMHVGGVRTALYAWALARQNGGTFILRIEDTDKAREVPGSIQQIIDSLKWIGITWDEGVDIGGPYAPYKQSERLESYQKYAKILIEKGLAYADPYSQEELEAFRKKADEEKRPFLYRDHRPENPPVWDGTKPLRLKTPTIKAYEWNDLVRGDLKAGPEALDDFVLIKSDGYPTYNFAHIIDDLEMGVTHIFRADEFISSTPRFLSLYEALGIERPLFATLPPILGAEGTKKLGKRDGAKDILDYKAEGYLPDAMMNFLAFIGWNPGDDREVFTPAQFIEAFSIKGIQNGGGKLNEEKLDWLNKEHIKLLSDADFKNHTMAYMSDELKNLPTFASRIEAIIPTLKERLVKFADVKEMETAGDLQYFFIDPSYDSALLLCAEKQRKGKEGMMVTDLAPIYEKLKEIISTLSAETDSAVLGSAVAPDTIKETIWPYAEQEGRGLVLWALRTALSGKERSPDPFTLVSIFGKEEAIRRIDIALQKINETTS
jgi:glutamyl-tRNA synthetase